MVPAAPMPTRSRAHYERDEAVSDKRMFSHQARLLQRDACGEARGHEGHHFRGHRRHRKCVLGCNNCPVGKATICHGGHRLAHSQALQVGG